MGAFQKDMLYREWKSTKSTGRWVVTRKEVRVCYAIMANSVYSEVLSIPGGVFTELVEAGYQFTCWKFHICNWQREHRLCCSISSLIAANTDMTQDPTEDNCFAIASKKCVIFQDTVHKIQINLKPTQGFEARHRV